MDDGAAGGAETVADADEGTVVVGEKGAEADGDGIELEISD